MQRIGKYIKNDFKIDDTDKYVSREFQKYAYDLAAELDDLKHVSLYMKLVKVNPRGVIDSARSFVKDAYNARSRPRLFMWKLKQLKDSIKEKKNVAS